MLRGKFWITPEGVFDVSTTEHKIFARKKMLCLDPQASDYPDARVAFSFIPCDHEIASLLVKPGVKREAVAWLRAGQDERLYAMKYWGWVRVARSLMNAWKLDEKTLALLRSAHDYWRLEEPIEPAEVFDFLETFSWKEGAIPLKYFTSRESQAVEASAMHLRRKYLKKINPRGI